MGRHIGATLIAAAASHAEVAIAHQTLKARANADLVRFSAEVSVDGDPDPAWASVHQWAVTDPHLTGQERSAFLDQVATDHGCTLGRGRRQPTRRGMLIVAAEPADWALVLAIATQAAAYARRVDA